MQINLEKGSIRASEITGDVDINGHVNSVSLDDVAGAVRLNGDFYEDIRLSKIAKTVIFKTSRSDMEIASVPGEIEISSDEVRGNRTRRAQPRDDEFQETSTWSPSPAICKCNPTMAMWKSRPAASRPGKMSVTTQHGDVALTLAGKTPPDKVNVATQHGDVTLTLSSATGFQINADTRKGSVSSDFDAVKISQGEGSSQASGTVGNGNSKLQVSTDTGDIRIVKS